MIQTDWACNSLCFSKMATSRFDYIGHARLSMPEVILIITNCSRANGSRFTPGSGVSLAGAQASLAFLLLRNSFASNTCSF